MRKSYITNMNASEIPRLRLQNTGLSHSPFKSPANAVSHLGAVQAQNFAAAKWALGLRVKNSTDEDIEKAFNEGTILRTHVMRPTWHFVVPEDIRWMLELTAPRVKALLAHYNRKLDLDDALFARSNAEIARALQSHTYLTRQELKIVLTSIGIETDVQRLAHIIMWAELDGLICSGPRRGKQFTYALLEERAEKTKKLDREQALAKLALNYFTGHGPAQLKDFSWWSGLTVKYARDALDLIKSELKQATFDGKTYWFPAHEEVTIPKSPSAFLLSIYDEYTIAYKDRSDISKARDIERMISMGNALTAVIILNGKVAGTWNKALKKSTFEIRLNPFRQLKEDEQEALGSEVIRYGKFVGIPAVLVK
ncbi:winged helix DNA-binding domain-containing protein [Methanosarcina sp. DH2]|uniref:winged helix DNA-binding domain-containing protein n=1 Tax=Methanosarcina sp. DH2 TaxID=2605639 RepID=UPI001E6052A5|nr:winged helix DNA-binding domain-containing protein [Methanosarcina sp. DH2]MCC4771461.1 winged helix DNA-binding domain-containing protein [Methanosarcina sp. DH2]